jgi:dimethylargininase
VLLFSPELVDAAQFEGVEALAVEERRGANCVRAGERLILAAGNPRTAEVLRSRGFHVVEVDVSELQKAESAVTCMSLIDERP